MSDAFLADTADHSQQEEARGEDTAQWATVGNKPDSNSGGPNTLFGSVQVSLVARLTVWLTFRALYLTCFL